MRANVLQKNNNLPLSAARQVLGLAARYVRGVARAAHLGAAAEASSPRKLTELSELLRSAPQRCIAFDVFDTLVARTVSPEHVKILASDRLCRLLGLQSMNGQSLYELRQQAERKICERNFVQYRELEFRFTELVDEMFTQISTREHVVPSLDRQRLFDLMMGCELEVERDVLEPTQATVAALQLVRASGKKIVLATDFYLPAAKLGPLLQSVVGSSLWDDLVVSSDLMASKRSGRLYPLLCRRLGIEPSDLLMVGDNSHSDYTQARAQRVEAVQVQDPDRITYYRSPRASVLETSHGLQNLRAVLASSSLSDARNLRPVIPSLHLFTERLYRAARQSGFRHLTFLAREGYVLQRMFELYQDSIGCPPAERIRTHYLLVSRRSCYATTLRDLNAETFDGLFRYYTRMSPRDFLKSLGLAADKIAAICNDAEVDIDQVCEHFPTSRALTRLRASSFFCRAYDAHRSSQRANLRSYLAGAGGGLDDRRLAVVDVGWKGSIQDYLSSAIGSELNIRGFYFGLCDVGQPLDNKTGLIFSTRLPLAGFARTYNENRTLLEIVLCAEHGSALRYDLNSDGTAVAVLDENADELDYIANTILPLRDDIIAGFRDFCTVRNRYYLHDSQLEVFAADCYAEIVFQPWRPVALTVAATVHRENFGSFEISRYSEPTNQHLRARLYYWYQLICAPRRTLASSFWPALTLYRNTNRLAARLYAARQRLKDHQADVFGRITRKDAA